MNKNKHIVMKNKQTSFIIIIIIIVLCIVVLLRTSFNQYSEQKVLESTSAELAMNNQQITKLDTINMGLQEAENDFRMYTSNWEKAYFIKYNKGIQRISSLLESFSRNDVKQLSSDISIDLAKKNKQILLYTKIKKLTDSLMSINLRMDSGITTTPLTVLKPMPRPATRKIIKVEETKTPVDTKKPKFFQRLKSAILNRPSSKDTAKTRKTETIYEQATDNAGLYTQKQIKEIENFYRNLFESQKKNHVRLTEKEQSILKLNQQILQNIKLMFHEFSYREHLIEKEKKEKLRDINLHAVKVIDTSGKINFMINMISFVLIVLLLIKLYRTYAKLVQANKSSEEQVIIKSRFFTSISHEMRTPLNAILGVTEQLKSTPLNEEQKAMSGLLESSSSMLLSAVNEVLDFSRLETGKLSLSKTPFYYKKIIIESVATTSVLARQKGLELVLNQQNAPDLLVIGDPYRLKQILVNLIANAIKFTDTGKVSVEVNVKHTSSGHIQLFLQVKDTGIGIAEKDLPYIFDEFSQVIHSKRRDWQKGSGLGLPICKKLISLHQGKITVESIVGLGTSFNLELPFTIAEQQKEGITDDKTSLLQTNAFKNIHLLVVDDAEMNLLIIKMIFNKRGISFDTANNGEEALAAFELHTYDMVLTDIEMPGIDGIELTKKIRAHQHPEKSQIPIIAITGQISPESHQHYISSGLNDYLIKPFKENELLEKILDYLP
jgi:signal transduction histidine kinase